MKKFAVFDVDGTFFRSGLYRELVAEFVKRGIFSDEEKIAIEDIERNWRQDRSQESFHHLDGTIIEMFEAHLATLNPAAYDEVARQVVENHHSNVFSYTSQLAQRLKSEGYTLIAISGSQHELVEDFMRRHGFDISVGLLHERDGNAFTGQSKRVYNNKHTILQEIVSERGLTFDGSVAIGDTAGDIEMMALADRAIAFNPDQVLLAHAKAQGWEVVVERKGCTYHLTFPDDPGSEVAYAR